MGLFFFQTEATDCSNVLEDAGSQKMVDRATQGCLVWSVIDGLYLGSSVKEHCPFCTKHGGIHCSVSLDFLLPAGEHICCDQQRVT